MHRRTNGATFHQEFSIFFSTPQLYVDSPLAASHYVHMKSAWLRPLASFVSSL